jgi:hypothetical protein
MTKNFVINFANGSGSGAKLFDESGSGPKFDDQKFTFKNVNYFFKNLYDGLPSYNSSPERI